MATIDSQQPATKQFRIRVREHIPIVTEAAVTCGITFAAKNLLNTNSRAVI